ncbi:hypothetical protein ACP0BV_00135 [Metamycoplasma hominis]|uniref:hypothetical protein n=1 Tax=Metamycoplasma hominis TaxID=2098 RepID=UPI003CF2E534
MKKMRVFIFIIERLNYYGKTIKRRWMIINIFWKRRKMWGLIPNKEKKQDHKGLAFFPRMKIQVQHKFEIKFSCEAFEFSFWQ